MKRFNTPKNRYRSISLFSGIGGLDIGLERVGFRPVFCSELDPNAAATLRAYLDKKGYSPYFQPDVNQVNPNTLMHELGIKPGEIDLLAGGPPCQSFSLIGKRQCLNDDRGVLLYKIPEFAEVFQPKVIMIEQVKGLLSASCEDNMKGGALSRLIDWLRSLGYITSHKVLLAADFGVPQLRERLFIVASKDKKFKFPEPTHFPESSQLFPNGISRYSTVKEALKGLKKPSRVGEIEVFPNHADITPARDQQRIHGVPEGECLAKQHHLPKTQRMSLTQKDTTKFRRLSWDKPALTLRGGEVFYHPKEDRYLTPREYLRLHGFDDDFILSGPIRGRSGSVRFLDQHRLVANAVPPGLAEVVGEEIVSQFLEPKIRPLSVSITQPKQKHSAAAYISEAIA
jgi:DNA (cytosine-5)-methyltransferase 1